MQFEYLWTLALCILVVSSRALASTSSTESDASATVRRMSQEYYDNTFSSLPQGSCTSQNIAVRKEWDALSEIQRLDYIRAVHCLISAPSKLNGTLARSRSEDFVFPHIEQNLHIHFSGLLLPWHRYFLSLYEAALRDECGYDGYLPYWDWSKSAEDPSSSSLFDGSPLSLSGNGKAIPHGTLNLTQPGGAPPGAYIIRPPGTGGGCVTGPFENFTLYLDGSNDGSSTPIRMFQRPRCLTRDFYLPILRHRSSYENVTEVLNSEDIQRFHGLLESRMGLHPGGHEYIGGENLNLFTSPHDPAFFLHHGMIDRVWAIWQSQDPSTRQNALDGTLTSFNYPPSPDATLEDWLRMSSLAPDKQIKHVMSATAGPFCYVYE